MMIAIALAWLVPFACILLCGTYTVQEPNKVILTLEILLFLAIVAYGIHCILYLIRSKDRRGDATGTRHQGNETR